MILNVFLIIQLAAAFAYDWEYNENWANRYVNCGKPYQSPIDIPPNEDLVPCFTALGLNITGFDKVTDYTILNNGHTAVVKVDDDKDEEVDDEIYYFINGHIEESRIRYKTCQFHFHWAENSFHGSEHTINGKRFPLELHIVSYNKLYKTVNEAMTQPDGLAVLSILFEVSRRDNNDLQPLITALEKIKPKGSKTTVRGLNVAKLVPKNRKCFYRYSGSLTTPNCYESVTWTIFCKTNKISERQLSRFRDLWKDKEGTRLGHNYRHIMERNGRHVCWSEKPWE